MSKERESVSVFHAGLGCRCPRCGKSDLFRGQFTLDVASSCSECGLDFKFIDSGDGPAVFAIMIMGILMLGGALAFEFTVHPPIWVHMLIWVPVTLGLAFGLLRPLKATLIALQFRNRAEEARLAGD
ncbi:MAG: DUF983 domain-containing protein [Hyphomicrobiaceae bacterium]